LGNQAFEYIRFNYGNYATLENELVKVDFLNDVAAPYKYTNKKNNSILWGDQSLGELENMVEVLENQKSIIIKPTIDSLQVFPDSIVYKMDCIQNNVLYAKFKMVYILDGNELKVQFKEVTERSDVHITWYRTPMFLSADGNQTGSTMIVPYYEGFSVDIQKSSEGYFETSSNIGWQFVLPTAMIYHSDFEGILSWTHQDLCSYYRIRKNSSNENEASMGMIFNYKYAPTDFSKASFIPVFDDTTNYFEVNISLIDDYDNNNIVDWLDGAKFIRNGININPYRPYLNSWLTFFYCEPGQFIDNQSTEIFKKLYHLSDNDTIISYILDITKYTGVCRFDGEPNELHPEKATLNVLKNTMQECKEKYNINLTLSDIYTDYVQLFPDYDPIYRVMLSDGSYAPGWPWENVGETYLIDAYDYMINKGIERVNKTLNQYSIERSYHIDALSLYARKSFTPHSPSSNTRFLEGIKILINEFNKRDINITSEGLSACFADYGLGWFRSLSPLKTENLNFPNSKTIPLLPIIYHGKTLYGQRLYAPTINSPIITSLLDALISGASSGSSISNGNLRIDEFYLIDLPWRTLNTRFMNDYEENGSYRKVTYDNNSFVEVDYDKDTYKVQVDGKVVAENYTTIYQKNDSAFLIYSRDPKEIMVDLPQGWTDKIKLYKLTEAGPVDLNIFSISGTSVAFNATGGTPYKLINVRHTANAPILESPKNAEQITSTHPVLTWQNVESVNTYHVMVSKSGDFNQIVYDTIIAGNTFNPVNLEANQPYYWKVRSINLVGTGNWSEVYSFSGAPVQRMVRFTSENDKIKMIALDSLPMADFTIEFLIKVDSITFPAANKEYHIIENRIDGAGRYNKEGFFITMYGDKLPLALVMVNDTFLNFGVGDAISAKTLHHIVILKKGDLSQILIDGEVKNTFTKSYSIKSTFPLEIGGMGCDVLMDEIRIWDYARDINDLNRFAKVKLTGNETGLKSYWNFDNDYNNIVVDESKNLFHGVLIGAARYVYSASENITICQGQNYNGWTTSGTYERIQQSSSGGDTIITTYLTVNPTIYKTESKAICNGQNYLGWTTSGTYQRTLQSSTGCDSIVRTYLMVLPASQPEVIVKGDTLLSTVTYTSYKWKDKNGYINGATNNQFIITKSGEYYLEVVDQNGCTQVSNPINAHYSSVYLTSSGNFKYSFIPNPNQGKFTFRVDSEIKEQLVLKLLNPLGQVIEVRQVKQLYPNHTEQFDVSHLSKGIYFLNISTGDILRSEEIIVQ
jgi:hypothetical protein